MTAVRNNYRLEPDQESVSERPCYHAHTRWNSPLPLTLAAPRRTPRCAIAADDDTMETYYHGISILIGRSNGEYILHKPLTLTLTLTSSTRRSMAVTHTDAKIKDIGQSV